MDINWHDNSIIKVNVINDEICISGNKEALKSLANILSDLSNEDVGSHIHLDKYNSLHDESNDLIIELIK